MTYAEWAELARNQPAGALEGIVYELVLKKFYEKGVTKDDLVKGVRLTRWDDTCLGGLDPAIRYTLELQPC